MSHAVAQPWDPTLLDALNRWGTDQTGHSDGSLLDHLTGTADRLRAWGNPPVICHAGLFHSIYGTQSFKIQTVPLDRRAEVAALIGPEAERLAYLFCVSRRRELWTGPPGEDLQIHDHADGAPRPVSAAEVLQLLEVEVANLLDQLPPRAEAPDHYKSYMETFAGLVRDRVSPGARAALEAWLHG